jgi:cytochrome c556
MKNKVAALTAALVAGVVVLPAALAEPTPEDAKDYRLSVMTSLRGHMVAASMHVRGLVEDNGFLGKHADGLANGAAELKHVFQQGSDVDDSEALPVIWEEPAEFAEAIETAQQATVAFQEAVAGGDEGAIGAAFRDVGAACRGCHDRFRVDDD